MMNKIIVRSLVAIGFLSIFLLVACSNENSGDENAYNLSLAAGGTGGTWYTVAGGISSVVASEHPNINISVQTGGASENNRLVGEGSADLAYASSDGAYYAYRGDREFDKEYENLRVIMAAAGMKQHFFVREDSDIESIQDLKGKTISIGAPGTSLEIAARLLFKEYGLEEGEDYTAQYLSFSETASAMKDGNIDAGFMMGSLPVAAAMDLTTSHDIKFLHYDEDPEIFERFLEDHPYWTKDVIPAGTYNGQDEDVTVLGVGDQLITRDDVDEEVIYNITKTLIENAEELGEIHPAGKEFTLDNVKTAVTIPFHEGAKKYLQEQGITFDD